MNHPLAPVREIFFRVGGYTGWDYLASLVFSDVRMARRIARKVGMGEITVLMPSGATFRVGADGRAEAVPRPNLPRFG